MVSRLMLLCLFLFVAAAWTAEAADATGRWRVEISAGDSTVTGVALLTQTGDRITGSMGANEQNQHPLDGVVKENQITITMHPKPGRTTAFAKCHLTVKGDTMKGTTEGGDLGGKATIKLMRDDKK